jgi:hypothetical protein
LRPELYDNNSRDGKRLSRVLVHLRRTS